MTTVCKENSCTGCMACTAVCAKNAISVETAPEAYNAVIDTALCVDCGACRRVCQVDAPLPLLAPRQWLQGWTADDAQRSRSASGGAAYEIEKAFLQGGGHVWTCRFSDGGFRIEEVGGVDALQAFANSKYVKSDPSGAYAAIREQLRTERVLFVGLPCQAAGLKRYIGEKNAERLYTADLICHGTPSPQMLEIFLKQYGRTLGDASDISFRTKTKAGIRYQVEVDSVPLEVSGVCDCYTMGFLEGMTYTRNCYSCPYAGADRVSDLTLGDSWGSELDPTELHRGISLFLVQTRKGEELIGQAALKTCPADAESAVQHNAQLREPMRMPKNRERFFTLLRSGSFNRAVAKCLPKYVMKQKVKAALIKTKLIGR